MEQKKVYTTSNNIFLNSERVFIEYDDVLKMPQYVLLCGLSALSIPTFSKIIDISEIRGYEDTELFEWYVTRKYQNIYMNFEPFLSDPKEEYQEMCDKVLSEHLSSSNIFYSGIDSELSFSLTVKELMKHKSLVGGITIYSKYDNPHIKQDISLMYPGLSTSFGDIREALKDTPEDSTYVFSNIEHILVLEELGKLDYSSILIADGYRYNYTSDTGELKIDLDRLVRDHLFKLDFFSVFG